MKVEKINHYKDKFKKHLHQLVEDYTPYEEAYKYENLLNFQQNWDLGDLDFHSIFNKSFKSKISNKLWGGSKDSPKSMMLEFINLNKEFVRTAFRDLFNEEKDITMRINRFGFHCDQMLDQSLEAKKKFNTHHHEDRKMAALYLSFNAPELYTLFEYPIFKKTMELLDTRSVPEKFEIERYFKLSKGLNTLISKDEELMEWHKELIKPYDQVHFGQMIVHDFYIFCGS